MGYEKHAFARDNVMPLLPVRELPLEGPDALTRFYASKVKCRECAAQPVTAAPVESLNQHLVAQRGLRSVPCEGLSIFSIRTVLKALLGIKNSTHTAPFPIYKTEADMKAVWRSLPGVQPGDNPESRLVKYAHCHEAVMWFMQHLSAHEQQVFAHDQFLPLLPLGELPLNGPEVLTQFYASKVKCPQCGLDGVVNGPIQVVV